MANCPLCRTDEAEEIPVSFSPFLTSYRCPICKNYVIERNLIQAFIIDKELDGKRHLLSAVTRRSSERAEYVTIGYKEIDALLDKVAIPKDPIGKIDRILLYIFRETIDPSIGVPITWKDYPIAFARGKEEFDWLLKKVQELGYAEMAVGAFRLTIGGWQHIDEISRYDLVSSKVFVAMWFHDSLGDAWENGFKAALLDLGWDPIRVDFVQHNEKADDRILVEINESRFVVADFTGNRGGVYFEAGYAKGLGKPVIWCCESKYFKEGGLHFDTRQFNHILWDNPADLFEKLRLRIISTMGSNKRAARNIAL